jgi:nicotinate-nucleotide pyrophosphorylase
MLDNFSPAELTAAAAELKKDWVTSGGEEGEKTGAKRCLIEVSGGLTEENMSESLCHGEFLRLGQLGKEERERKLIPSFRRRRHPLDFVDPSGRLHRRL